MTLLVAAADYVIWDILFRSVRATSRGLISVGSYVFVSDKSGERNLDVELAKMDLKNRTNVISALLDEMNCTSPAVKTSIQGLRDVIKSIRDELEKIEKSKIEHKNKWFNSWRHLDCDDSCKNLVVLSQVLDKRLTLLHLLGGGA